MFFACLEALVSFAVAIDLAVLHRLLFFVPPCTYNLCSFREIQHCPGNHTIFDVYLIQ